MTVSNNSKFHSTSFSADFSRPSYSNTLTSSVRLKRRKKLPFIDDNVAPPTAVEAVTNILYNTPTSGPSPITRHTLNCLVSNEPGVLSRVSGILAGRGFNIDSLVVAKTEVPDLSRMTVILNGKDSDIEQARKQLDDLVPVWAVLDFTHAKVLEREMLMVKVWTVPHEHFGEDSEAELSNEEFGEYDNAGEAISPLLSSSLQRQSINELAQLFGGKIVDVGIESVIVELTANPDRIDAFLQHMKPFGIIEAARSGSMAMPRSVILSETDEVSSSGPAVDATLLPPG
ncbi:hypothetical protein HK096_008698 [Nowakowskiella sp. JEL0078]|nr:hypothetical protein HK096_008698 [Nowakowskiella sp. JEL0078]